VSKQDVVDAFAYNCFIGDNDEAASFLANDLKLRGSINHFDQAAPVVKAMCSCRRVAIDVQIHSRFYANEKTVLLCDCTTNTEAGLIRSAEFFRVEGNTFDHIRLVFHPTRLRQAMEKLS